MPPHVACHPPGSEHLIVYSPIGELGFLAKNYAQHRLVVDKLVLQA